MILHGRPTDVVRSGFGRTVQDPRQIHFRNFGSRFELFRLDQVGATDNVVQPRVSEFGQRFADIFGQKVKEIDQVLVTPAEMFPQPFVLRSHADRTSVHMALAHHHAPQYDQRARSESDLLGPEPRGDPHVAAGFQLAVGLQRDFTAQTVQHEGLLYVGQADFGRQAGMFHRADRTGSGTAFAAADQDHIGFRFSDSGRNGADSAFGNQFHADPRARIDILQVENQLRQVLDRINIVVRRRRDQRNAGDRMPRPGDHLVDFVTGELSALAGLGPLGDLDLDLVGIDQVFGMDAETSRSHLFDRAAGDRTVRIGTVTPRVLAAFAERTERHRTGYETLHDLRRRLHERQVDRIAFQFHQIAQKHRRRFFVDKSRILLEFLVTAQPRGQLQRRDRLRIPRMPLAVLTIGVIAEILQRRILVVQLPETVRMSGQRIDGEVFQIGPADLRSHPPEIPFQQSVRQSHRFEDLRAAVTADRRNPHLGDNFQ